MRIAIVGAGSIGSLYAALLSKVEGVELLVHARGQHGAVMASQGLTIEGEASMHVSNERVFFSLDEVGLPNLLHNALDIVVITGKADHTEQLALHARSLLAPGGFALCLSNGLGHAERCVEVLGPHRVFAATTTHGAWRPQPGVIHWAGVGHTVVGSLPGGPGEVEALPFLEVLKSAGLNPAWTSDGLSAVWRKVLLNISINPIASLAGVENGSLLSQNLFSAAYSTMLEGASVARIEGVSLPDDAELEAQLREVLIATSGNICSMLQDIRSGRTTEISVLNQAIVERGERAGVATPLNQMLSSMITALHFE